MLSILPFKVDFWLDRPEFSKSGGRTNVYWTLVTCQLLDWLDRYLIHVFISSSRDLQVELWLHLAISHKVTVKWLGVFKALKKNFFFLINYCCPQAFSSCSERELLSSCGVWTSRGGSWHGAQALCVQASAAACGLWSAGSMAVAPRLVTGFVLFIAETSD